MTLREKKFILPKEGHKPSKRIEFIRCLLRFCSTKPGNLVDLIKPFQTMANFGGIDLEEAEILSKEFPSYRPEDIFNAINHIKT